MKKRSLASLMIHPYKKLPVTMKMWMQFNVMPRGQHARQTMNNCAIIESLQPDGAIELMKIFKVELFVTEQQTAV